MNVLIMSVPHTGTTFTEVLLKANLGLHPTDAEDRGENLTHREHTYNDEKIALAKRLLKEQPMPLIVPFRHPFVAEEAWNRRGYEIDRMILSYRNLFEHFIPLDPYIMAVDSPRREECLTRLSEGLGVDLQTDWTPVRSVGETHAMSWREMSPSDPVRTLAADLDDFLLEWYP